MTPNPFAVSLKDSLEDVQQLMEAHKIRHVPVLDAGRLAGIFTMTDACRCLLDLLKEAPGLPLAVSD